MSGRTYVEAEGLIHLVNTADGASGEFTLCGDGFDLDTEVPGYEWVARKRGPVTCEHCADIIRLCQGVRTHD